MYTGNAKPANSRSFAICSGADCLSNTWVAVALALLQLWLIHILAATRILLLLLVGVSCHVKRLQVARHSQAQCESGEQ